MLRSIPFQAVCQLIAHSIAYCQVAINSVPSHNNWIHCLLLCSKEKPLCWDTFSSLDNFICSWSFFCQVKYWKVVNIVIRRDNTSILTTFKMTAIKFKVNEKVVAQTDWKLIWYHKLTNEIFNNSLSKSIAGSTTYSKYNNHIIKSGINTTTFNNQKNKGWFHFRRESLFPLIKERYELLSDYRTLGIGKGDSSEAKLRLRVLQLAVHNAISLAKSAWSDHQSEKYTPCVSTIRKCGRVSVLSLEETWVITPRPPLCRCNYPTGTGNDWCRKCLRIWSTVSQGL